MLETRVSVCYLDGIAGKLFAIFKEPRDSPSKRAVLIAPPFAEEVNKSRRQISLQAQQLNNRGWAVLQLDLFGTADSEGDFRDARWGTWTDDICLGVEWLKQQGYERVVILGVRLGCMLAAACCARVTDISTLVFWQPVPSGKVAINQFLRLRLAADMLNAGDRVTLQDLRDRLDEGKIIEIAGYEVSPELVKAIDKTAFEDFERLPPVNWLEVSATAGMRQSPVSERVISGWRDKGMVVKSEVVEGPSFWRSAEIEVAGQLLVKTSQLFVQL